VSVATLREVVEPAFAERYGVPAINIFNDLTLEAVLAGAEKAQSPIIVQTSVKTVKSIGADVLAAMWQAMVARVSVPAVLHLDHCPDVEVVKTCLANGWNSVLFDGSSLPADENLALTKQVVEFAKPYGAQVEGELEAITGVEDDHGSDDEAERHSLQASLDFIDETGIDVFAPSIGNAHGAYKSTPVLDFDRVSDLVRERNIPIALHGGSGMTNEQFAELISRGCAKVNISTSLKETYMKQTLAFLKGAESADKWDPPSLFASVHSDIVDLVVDLAEQFGSAGKAGA
jgi:ketose-bisphosphate aldolase